MIPHSPTLPRITIEPTFAAWREQARRLLRARIPPEQVQIMDISAPALLPMFVSHPLRSDSLGNSGSNKKSDNNSEFPRFEASVPHQFISAAETVAVHSDPQRWQLLYSVLWRLQTERNLLHIEVDDDVAQLRRLQKQVSHDIHKMHAFLRFRKLEDHNGEHYVAWYKPAHHILRLATPFFRDRFAVMRWTILTPEESASWTPGDSELRFGPGVPREMAPDPDELETLWKTYYAAIFNPARINTRAMRQEMPTKYWSTLPELDLLPKLVDAAQGRVQSMLRTQQSACSAAGYVPGQRDLQVLREALPACRGCDLWAHATQPVPGAGNAFARLMLVGEQPGNEEDLAGKPFVGPAGQVLQRAMDELGLARDEVYLTNAVKHFKFIERGKRRIHLPPRLLEINACRPWLLAEIEAVRPHVIVCLGASAARSLLGSTFRLMEQRGAPVRSPYASRVLATVHPSAVLRATDPAVQDQLYSCLKQDLALANSLLAA